MKKTNDSKSLPWWVELLFVQIGLPDKWLRSFLKARKRFKHSVTQNYGDLKVAFLFLVFMIYLTPLIRQAETTNQCIRESKEYIKNNLKNKTVLTEVELKAISTHFCNGGNI